MLPALVFLWSSLRRTLVLIKLQSSFMLIPIIFSANLLAEKFCTGEAGFTKPSDNRARGDPYKIKNRDKKYCPGFLFY
jgi:hypothetical protein